MTKRILLGAAASLAAVCGASAAAAQTTNDNVWAGPYVGANVGGTWGNTSLRASAAQGPGPSPIPIGDIAQIAGVPITTNSSTAGFAIGGEAGYNYQMDTGCWASRPTAASSTSGRAATTPSRRPSQ